MLRKSSYLRLARELRHAAERIEHLSELRTAREKMAMTRILSSITRRTREAQCRHNGAPVRYYVGGDDA